MRHLVAADVHVEGVLARPLVQMEGLPRAYADIATGLDVRFWRVGTERMHAALDAADRVVDALLGATHAGPLRGNVAEVAAAVRTAARPVFAVDVPTGLDATTGKVARGALRADATVTFGLPKCGMAGAAAAKVTGRVWVAGLDLPAAVYAEAGVPGPYPGTGPDGLAPWTAPAEPPRRRVPA